MDLQTQKAGLRIVTPMNPAHSDTEHCARVAARANLRVSPGPGVLELTGYAEVGKLRLEPWKLHPSSDGMGAEHNAPCKRREFEDASS